METDNNMPRSKNTTQRVLVKDGRRKPNKTWNKTLQGATSRFAHLKKFSFKFSSSSFVIRFNLLYPSQSNK